MTFPFTLYKNKKANGINLAPIQLCPYAESEGFDVYLQTIAEAQSKPPIAKDDSPVFLHGLTHNALRNESSMLSLSAMTLDCDGASSLEGIQSFLEAWPFQYLLQYRWALSDKVDGVKQDPRVWAWKYHLVLPFREPIPYRLSLGDERTAFRLWISESTGHSFDAAQDGPASLLYYYSPRPGDPNLPVSVSASDRLGLDWERWLALRGIIVPTNLVRRTRALAEPFHTDNIYLKAFERFNPVPHANPSQIAYEITCPHDHTVQTDRKTVLFLGERPKIVCFADQCHKQPLPYFLAKLNPEEIASVEGILGSEIRLSLTRAITPAVSLGEAQARIAEAITENRPTEKHATVIRVSPGAGKSHAILRHLETYAHHSETDEETGESYGGRSAILATPTNALADELGAKLSIPFQRNVGPLAVRNEDGSPACVKYDVAAPLQKAGANIHVLMCSKCEYKPTCPAILGRVSGAEGALLILTNHALLPSLVQNNLKSRPNPLPIWDESPTMVDSATIENHDLEWLVDTFDTEARPKKGTLMSQFTDVSLFSERYRKVVRPLIEVLRSLTAKSPTPIDPEDYVKDWGRLPLHQALLAGSEAQTHTVAAPSASTLTRIGSALRAGDRFAAPEVTFDKLREDQMAPILRASRLLEAASIIFQPEAVVFPTGTSIIIAGLSDSGDLFKTRGGVILDATASVIELKALHPFANVVDIRVESSPDTHRTHVPCKTLSRSNLKHHPRALHDGVTSLSRALRRVESILERKAKVVCFTYLDRIPEMRDYYPEYSWHHYGDTRGYDQWFQEGYDVFATFGDAISNLEALALKWYVLFREFPSQDDPKWIQYVTESGAAETAQAHGRARDPQAKLTDGGRRHYHYGRIPPAGWDLTNTTIDATLTPIAPLT